MNITYHGNTHFPGSLKIRFLALTITFNVKEEPVRGWIPLIIASNLLNFILWPFVIVWAARLLGLPIAYSFDSWLGLVALYSFMRFFADESREAVT